MVMKRPIIGIIGIGQQQEKPSIMLYEEYRTAIIKAGGLPILLLPPYPEQISFVFPFTSNITDEQRRMIESQVDLCDGILFPGGDAWYGYEQYLLEYAKQKGKAILGICLGMQMIANMRHFHEAHSDYTIPISSHLHYSDQQNAHSITLQPSKLKSILNCQTCSVTSRHHFQILPDDSFIISSVAKDGVIESIEDPASSFLIGVQWHPESNYEDPHSKALFRSFIESCFK